MRGMRGMGTAAGAERVGDGAPGERTVGRWGGGAAARRHNGYGGTTGTTGTAAQRHGEYGSTVAQRRSEYGRDSQRRAERHGQGP